MLVNIPYGDAFLQARLNIKDCFSNYSNLVYMIKKYLHKLHVQASMTGG